MAYTITDSPRIYSPVNQKLIVVMYDDTNNSNVGFKYFIRLTDLAGTVLISEHVIEKNVNGYGVFDLSPVLKDITESKLYNDSGTSANVYKSLSADIQVTKFIQIECGWGDTTSGDFVTTIESTIERYFWDCYTYPYQGYRPDMELEYRINHLDNANPPRQLLSAIERNASARYRIPSLDVFDKVFKCGTDDWGVISFISKTGGDIWEHTPVLIQYKLYASDHSLLAQGTYTFTEGGFNIKNFGAFPQNILAQDDWNSPSIYPNWAYYSLQFFDANIADPSRPYPVKPKYWFYREECEARFTKVRLGWLNHHGGRDQFNFTKKNEISHEVERKQYKRILGDYSTAGGTFTMDANVGQIVETPIQSKMYITITSDWIDKFDFKYLTSLIRSKQVHIIDTDGNITPVVVEENNWLERNDKSAKQYNVTLKLRFANGYQAWQI